jgi:hypothetical protein
MDRYWYEYDASEPEAVALQRVRALVTNPADGEALLAGDVAIRGAAWSGAAPIAGVEVSIDNGPWSPARLIGDRRRHSWQWWELLTTLDQPGQVSIRARASDLAGHTQPDQPIWNRRGYGNNAIQTVVVNVTA